MTIAYIFIAVLIIFVVVLVVISGQRRDAAWKQLAAELGAVFIQGSFFRSSKVEARIKGWTITLDAYSVPSGDSSDTYTRMKAPLQNKDGFQFTIFRTGLVAKLDKALGAQDIEIGDPDFDRDFTVQANNESKVRALFANQGIRQVVQAQKSIRLGIRNNELYFESHGVIKDVERLKSLFELFKTILGQLEG